MTSHLTHDEIRELLAVYALDAVDDDEAETIELHLRGCPRCRAEVADHRETAGALATGHEQAPVHLWDNIVSTLEEAPPMELARLLPLRAPRERRVWRVAVGAAAAALIGVVGVRHEIVFAYAQLYPASQAPRSSTDSGTKSSTSG